MLEIKNITKSYGKKIALKNFSYTFDTGIYGLLGANGAGKSTLMNLITDNIKIDTGTICYDGTDILKFGAVYRIYIAELAADDSPEELIRSVDGCNLEDVFMHYAAKYRA